MKQLLIIMCTVLMACQSGKENPADQTLRRVLGDEAERFKLKQVNDDADSDWFEIEVSGNKIQIQGNSPISLCKGAYFFIRDNGYGVITWEGTNVSIPKELRDTSYSKVESAFPLRMYLNPCTYGYTMAWWDWERWEEELDWMAIHGINMPIALLGQEYVWQQVWEDMGISKSKLEDYYCGPAFLPWFRMGNIYNHIGPLPQTWIEKDKVLQQKVLNRMRELGMRPVVPAFSGHVPPFFKKLYPKSVTYQLKGWGGLEPEKASLLLDPRDSLFMVIGTKFLKKYEDIYGSADMFLADAFNEMLPPVSVENKYAELTEYGEAIFKSIKRHNPKASWVIQGWTFGHQGYFWTQESTKAFFNKIPKERLLMLNYGEDRYSIWEKLDAFYGFKWTYGYVHNYGGQQSLFGDLRFYHDKFNEVSNSPKKKNLVGYGCLPEAIENNSVVYEYIFDAPWGGARKSVSEWLNQYVVNRYGKASPKVKEAWNIALDNTYSVKEWRTSKLGYGTYIHNNRPSMNIHKGLLHGNPKSVASVLSLLLDDLDQYQNSDLYFYDILDFAQHYTACLADLRLVETAEHYKNKNFKLGDKAFEQFEAYLSQLEVLQLGTGGSFTKWCNDAVSYATTEEERLLYLRNAKTQISIWGGNRLKDYASKSWSGILLDFYLPRWKLFFDDYKQDPDNFDGDAARNKVRQMEEEWTMNSSLPFDPEPISKEAYIQMIRNIIK